MAPRAPIRSSLVTTMLRVEVERVLIIPKVLDRWGDVNALVLWRLLPRSKRHATRSGDDNNIFMVIQARIADDQEVTRSELKVVLSKSLDLHRIFSIKARPLKIILMMMCQ